MSEQICIVLSFVVCSGRSCSIVSACSAYSIRREDSFWPFTAEGLPLGFLSPGVVGGDALDGAGHDHCDTMLVVLQLSCTNSLRLCSGRIVTNLRGGGASGSQSKPRFQCRNLDSKGSKQLQIKIFSSK